MRGSTTAGPRVRSRELLSPGRARPPPGSWPSSTCCAGRSSRRRRPAVAAGYASAFTRSSNALGGIGDESLDQPLHLLLDSPAPSSTGRCRRGADRCLASGAAGCGTRGSQSTRRGGPLAFWPPRGAAPARVCGAMYAEVARLQPGRRSDKQPQARRSGPPWPCARDRSGLAHREGLVTRPPAGDSVSCQDLQGSVPHRVEGAVVVGEYHYDVAKVG